MRTRLFSLILLGLFVAALLPLPPGAVDDATDLRTAIVSLRHLDRVAADADPDFNQTFTHTIVTFKALAGLSITVGHSQPGDVDQQFPTVSTRVAYLLQENSWATPVASYPLDDQRLDNFYLSCILTPETPPPVLRS